ncbi:Mpv17-like 1 [Homarus americanus]|uniref:Mpv17-like 1 n=1 Tax=Homarus americanus TaxID=6706 RepID=A0A8J5N783_HOMAM|nr:Mpv17-like 1 [Homarus americanus]
MAGCLSTLAKGFWKQAVDGSRTSYDLLEALRYGVYGSCLTAPLLYKWIKVLCYFIPGTTLRHAIAKGYVDQLVFAPLNISQFYLGMSLLEGRPLEETVQEWQDKMLPTWMISLSIWPVIQTLNFSMVPEKNRVMAISCGSFLWMIFLSYMHHTKAEELPEELTTRRVHYDYKHGQREVLEFLVAGHKFDHTAAAKVWSGSVFPVTAHCSPSNTQPQGEEVVKKTQ